MNNISPIGQIAATLNIENNQIEQVLKLFAEKATIPFIARYRKELTGGLDEVQIADIKTKFDELVELEKRRDFIIESIVKQGKMTPELEIKIKDALVLAELEDLYLPYKIKVKSKATIAKNRGLEPLAQLIFAQDDIDPQIEAMKYINKEVIDAVAALQGARDIIAEWINEDARARELLRKLFMEQAVITALVKKSKQVEAIKFKDYFDFSEVLNKIPSHRLLAVNRGAAEGFLKVSIAPSQEEAWKILIKLFVKGSNSAAEQVALAIEDSYKRLLHPSLEAEFAKLSKQKADQEAINVFTLNLKQLLLEAPLGQKVVLGIDPGFRTGCKVVVLDAQGAMLIHLVIFPDFKKAEAEKIIKMSVEKFKVEAIAIGNGTASRETEEFINKLNLPKSVSIFMVSENGASVYSASAAAREEFPDEDVTVRGAISIGRRLMDPLAELVKIDPKAIGVGQYQHDVDQKLLKDSLDMTVEHCVNLVGVNLNTASKHLLTYVSGLGPVLAQNIVDLRKSNGPFKSRIGLKKVKKLGPKAYEQCAGFLKVPDAKNPLDNSAVHPESYLVVERMAKDLGLSIKDMIGKPSLEKSLKLENYVTETVGLPTLKDILKELEKPGLDPRGKVEPFSFASGIHKPEDLQNEMELPGIVTNITDFGAFVDIGVHQDGLLHISRMAKHFIAHPSEVVTLHQKLNVKVVEVDLERKRISLALV